MRRVALVLVVTVFGCSGGSADQPIAVGAAPDAAVVVDAGPVTAVVAPLTPSECTTDSDCESGSCVPLPGCGEESRNVCVPTEFLPAGEYCGCDGGVFTRPADPFRPWQGPGACGLDAGLPPPNWREFSWSANYDDAGVRFAPRIRQLAARLKLVGEGANRVPCAGRPMSLLPPSGVTLPEAKGLHRAFVGCGTEVPITAWSTTGVKLKMPESAPGECVWVAEATDEDVAVLQAACAKFEKGEPLPFSGGAFAPPDRCLRPEGEPINLLHRLPELSVSAFGSAGPAEAANDAGLSRIFSEARASFTWDAGVLPVEIRVANDRRKRLSAGIEDLAAEGELRWVVTNECGETVKRFKQTKKASFSLPRGTKFEKGAGVLEVQLDKAPSVRTTVKLDKSKLAKGVVVPDSVVVEPGRLKAEVPVRAPRGGYQSLGAVRLSAEGYEKSEYLELRAVAAPRGFADLHVHMFSNLGFGTTGFYGKPNGPLQDSLRECSAVHGANGWLDLLNLGTKVNSLPIKYWSLHHDTHGADGYGGWPDALDYTHQQVHHSALKRAWDGGMRLMVLLAVNNITGCKVAPVKNKLPCDDMGAVRRQLDGAHEFAASADALLPDGTPWFRIVRTAEEARDAILHDQLAVILGVEVDFLGECKFNGTCNEASVDALITELYDRDVRHVFPIHFATNAFGGSAQYSLLTSGDSGSCPGDYSYSKCSKDGLSPLGKYFIGKLMERKMIIDIDHQGYRSRAMTLDLAAAAKYPVVSGHAWMWNLMRHGARHEGTLTTWQQKQVYELGGLVGVLTNPSDHLDDLVDFVDAQNHAPFPQMCGKSVETLAQSILEAGRGQGDEFRPIAFGSDFNGFAGQVSGRGTGQNSSDDARACVGSKKVSSWKPAANTLVTYPFQDDGDVSFDRSAFGGRLYDINTDGFAHIGMYPDVLQALRKLGMTEEQLDPIMYSADGYVRMWERIAAR